MDLLPRRPLTWQMPQRPAATAEQMGLFASAAEVIIRAFPMIAIGTARKLLEAAWERLLGFDIFITYTRRDGEAYAVALKRALEREYLVFLDNSAIHGGQSIRARIRREISRCRLHLVVLTPEAVDRANAPWVFEEVAWHFDSRREPRIQTIFFPPNTPRNLPPGLERLAEHKGVDGTAGRGAGRQRLDPRSRSDREPGPPRCRRAVVGKSNAGGRSAASPPSRGGRNQARLCRGAPAHSDRRKRPSSRRGC